jgi:hypothetical protein
MGYCITNQRQKGLERALLADFRNRLREASMRAHGLNRHFAPKISVRERLPPHGAAFKPYDWGAASNQDTWS